MRLIKGQGWRQRFKALVAASLLSACGLIPEPIDTDADMLIVGDSILAWNRESGQAIGNVIAQETGLNVNNVAISGATFLGFNSIPSQYVSNDWTWVLVDGGGNDLNGNCGTAAEAEILDALISADATSGAYVTFAEQVAADGATLLIMDYYPISIQGGPFVPCIPAFDILTERLVKLANSRDDIIFIDTDQVIAPDNLAAYDTDLVHPTPLGSALIGRQIADVIR